MYGKVLSDKEMVLLSLNLSVVVYLTSKACEGFRLSANTTVAIEQVNKSNLIKTSQTYPTTDR